MLTYRDVSGILKFAKDLKEFGKELPDVLADRLAELTDEY